ADISALAGGFLGEVTPPPSGADRVRIDAINVIPVDGGLFVAIAGYLEADVPWSIDDINDNFTYFAKLLLDPSGSVDTNKVMAVGTDPGYYFQLDNWDGEVEQVAGERIRAGVESRFADAINAQILSRPELQLFLGAGYTLSFRSVTTTPAGIEV